MTEEKKQGNSPLTGALPITLVLALLAGLIFKPDQPYRDERPSNKPVKYSYSAAQDLDARLWQDPFAAINSLSEESQNKENNKPSLHSPSKIFDGYQPTKNERINIIAITLSGGPYQEASEIRMRRRYAVLSALANQKVIPQDEQHIGYFYPKSNTVLQSKIPFEWWLSDNKKEKFLLLWIDEISLLKTPASQIKDLLIQTSNYKYLSKKQITYAVIGPNSSSLLLDMMKEAEVYMNKANVSNCSKRQSTNSIPNPLVNIEGQPIRYFSAGATASELHLLLDADVSVDKYGTVSCYLFTKGINLYRTTATDSNMMAILINELKLRLPKILDHIVILSEWDTYYGRTIPKAFEDAWKKNKALNKDNAPIIRFGYMRGLDGKLPDKVNNVPTVMEKFSGNKDNENHSKANSLIEFPEGQHQKDYLRRLADQILTLDQNLKLNGNQLGIAAIGVLGSDVHDKLLLLEALRHEFPHKLFFTTDLDAAYFHPTKLQQTHNLLVASAFDLKLRPELQAHIPPFRDSYQTAFFLAMQLILNYDNATPDKIKIPPLLFEIGRTHPILLPENGMVDPLNFYDSANDNWLNNRFPFTNKINELSIHTNKDKVQCSWTNLVSGCDYTVQPNSTAASTFIWTWNNVITFLMVTLLFSFVSSWFRKKVLPFMIGFSIGLLPPLFLATINSSNWLPRLWAFTILAFPILFVFNWFPKRIQINPTIYLGLLMGVLLLITPPMWNAYIIQPEAEPFYWREGISIWPSQIFRLSIILFASFFFYWGKKRINRMLNEFQAQPGDKIHSTFALPNQAIALGFSKELFIGSWNRKVNNKPSVFPKFLWKKYLGYFSFNIKIGLPESLCRFMKHPDYWQHKKFNLYFYDYRTGAHAFVFTIVTVIFILQSGLPNIPARGDFALSVNKIIIFFAVFLTILLLTWVVENARLCEKLITHLSEKPSRWHQMAKNWAYIEKKVDPECINDWLDIQMVRRLTATIQPLIFGPVICIALLLIARSPLIDDWDLPWGLKIVFFTMLVYSISAELSLQHGAKMAREKAIVQLTLKISEQRNQKIPSDFVIKRIENQIECIRNLNDGAFNPWYKWPLLQSFGGLGTLAVVLQYLAGVWGNGDF